MVDTRPTSPALTRSESLNEKDNFTPERPRTSERPKTTERPKTSERPKTTERQESIHSTYSDEKFDEKANTTIEIARSINGDFDEEVKVVDPADDSQEKPIGI